MLSNISLNYVSKITPISMYCSLPCIILILSCCIAYPSVLLHLVFYTPGTQPGLFLSNFPQSLTGFSLCLSVFIKYEISCNIGVCALFVLYQLFFPELGILISPHMKQVYLCIGCSHWNWK